MLPLEQPDRIQIAFDDHRLVANAGLLLPVTLAQRLGLSRLVDRHVDLGRAPGRANAGDKMMTLVASASSMQSPPASADVLRTGRTAGAIGGVVKVPSTLGTVHPGHLLPWAPACAASGGARFASWTG